jgi:hypothetical protein
MASVHLFNFFKHHPRESGNPPADGGLGPDFKDMSLVQLMAAYWKVKAWQLDVNITFTSDWTIYSDPDVPEDPCVQSQETTTTSKQESMDITLTPEGSFNDERSLICRNPYWADTQSTQNSRTIFYIFSPAINGAPSTEAYYKNSNTSYGSAPLFDSYFFNEGFSLFLQTGQFPQPSSSDYDVSNPFTKSLSISWFDKVINYEIGLSIVGFGTQPEVPDSPSGNCGYALPISQSQKIVSFTASLTATEYWNYSS